MAVRCCWQLVKQATDLAWLRETGVKPETSALIGQIITILNDCPLIGQMSWTIPCAQGCDLAVLINPEGCLVGLGTPLK